MVENVNLNKKSAKEYEKYVNSVTPKHNIWCQMGKAFLVGGLICVLGQFIVNTATNSYGLNKEDASAWCSLILIALSALLTGLNVYPCIVKWGGAGALVPITGFANSVVSPAIEFKKEGWVSEIADDVIRPSKEECFTNPRARSAKLRWMKK
jgi:stage V sporulation protein AC